MKMIKTIGIVGAGTMGSGLAQKFAQEGFNVILADRSASFVNQGLSRIHQSLEEGIEKKVFSPEQVGDIQKLLKGTDQLNDLGMCDLIIEAIYEDFNAKCELFRSLSLITEPDTILATNTSSFSVTELAAAVKYPERFIGLHYFYHAAKNRLVEIVPGKETSPEITKSAYRFSVLSGKDPIFTKDVYGFAINRFFVPWLNEAVRLLEEGAGTMEFIDEVCKKDLGIGMGPFALMNATGIQVARHAQQTFEVFGPSYKVANLLDQQVMKKENWPLREGELKEINPGQERLIHERMFGVIFFVCSQILEEEICSPIDLNKGAKIGLRWKIGPVELMKKFGVSEVTRLVKDYAMHYHERNPLVKETKWHMDIVTLRKEGDRAVITMNRPEDLNALNEDVITMLDEKFSEAESDPSIQTIFMVGSGKAFVAGADIKFFVKNIKNNSLDKIEAFAAYGQKVFKKIDSSSKKVVAVLNGMTLGGGLELALCADVILSVPKTIMAFPETGIGIYPGLGGTQRCAERIGKGLAKFLILTGRTLKANEAFEIGLVDAVLPVWEIFRIIDGTKMLPQPVKVQLTGKWKDYESLYAGNSYQNIINGNYSNGHLEKGEVQQLGAVMSHKAPVAMQLAEELIEAGRGPQSEIEKMNVVFSTSDALLGLTNIGKRVTYTGK